MQRLVRSSLLLVALAIALVLLICGSALGVGADQFSITGPSAEAAIVQQTLEESTWDWHWGRDETTPVTITSSHPPYWGQDLKADVLSCEMPFLVFDQYGTVAGVSYYPSCRIYIRAGLEESWLREVTMHEAAHTRVMFRWFDLRPEGVSVYESPALLAWQQLTSAGTPGTWYYDPVEHHAEWFRITYSPPYKQSNPKARTFLAAPPRGVADVIAFHKTWCPAPEEPQPPVPEPPWPDIPTDDYELVAASIWAHGWGIFVGYEDGNFGPWNEMLKRHVYLVSARCGYVPPAWSSDYDVATRADVRDNIPNLKWEEERWEEPITRSQLMRLMFRSWVTGGEE